MYKANVNFSALKEQLNFLTKQGLVEERKIGKTKVVYALTPRGRTVLLYFHELKQAFPIIDESRKQTAMPY
jgi:predicted transcriptional regulator